MSLIRIYNRVPFDVIMSAHNGDIDAIHSVQLHFEQYIQWRSRIRWHGSRYPNYDLYDRMKTKLIHVSLKFPI